MAACGSVGSKPKTSGFLPFLVAIMHTMQSKTLETISTAAKGKRALLWLLPLLLVIGIWVKPAQAETRLMGSSGQNAYNTGAKCDPTQGTHWENRSCGFEFAVGCRLAPKAGSILQKASSAANRAAGSIGKWVPKNKHLLGGGSQSKAKFITDNVGQVRNWVQQALQSPNANFLPNPNIPGTFRVVTDMGQAVGIKGQQWIRAVVGMDGQVINAFPVHGL